MTYYFTLSNKNTENFYSSNWIIFGTERIFGGGVIIKTPKNVNKLSRCNLLRSSDTRTLFEIDLSEGDMYTRVVSSEPGYITLVKLTNDKNVKPLSVTLLHRTTEFFDLTPNGYSLKGMLPITKPEWSWDVKPLTMKSVESAGILEDMRKMSMFESDKRVRIPEIKEVIFNKPATVVYWKDGDKTTVKCGKDEESFDREKAVAMCFLKKMFKPSIKSHWLDVINDAIQAADDKVAKVEAEKAEKARIKAENIAKAEEARRKKAEKKAAANKIEEIQKEIKSNPSKPLEEMPEKKDNTSNKELFETIQKEDNKVVLNKNGKVKIDQDLMLECIKEKLTIDEIAEMNSWDKAAVARMYYKITGTKPEKKPNTYSELDALFEQGVSVDAAARRTGFSKNIVAMRYAKLQNRNNKE